MVIKDCHLSPDYVVEQGQGPRIAYLPVAASSPSLVLGEGEAAPEPQPGQVMAVVKKQVFGGILPKPSSRPTTIQGMVVGRVESLDNNVRRKLVQIHPDVDWDHLLLISEGSKPTSPEVVLTTGGVGLGLLLPSLGAIGAILYFKYRRDRSFSNL